MADVPATPSPFLPSKRSQLANIVTTEASKENVSDENSQLLAKNGLSDMNAQIEAVFARIQSNFDHNSRVFRSRSTQVLQKIEELESSLKEILTLMQESENLGLDEDLNAAMSAAIAQDDLPHKTPSQSRAI